MTAAIQTTIRQQLRKTWVRWSACLSLLLVGYVLSAGQVAGVAYGPFGSIPGKDQIQRAALTFYTPAFVLAGSDYAPDSLRRFLAFSMGNQRNEIAQAILSIAIEDWPESRNGIAPHLVEFAFCIDDSLRPGPCGSCWCTAEDDIDFVPLVSTVESE